MKRGFKKERVARIANVLKALKAINGLNSYKKVAELAGISITAVRKHELELEAVSDENLNKYFWAYRVPKNLFSQNWSEHDIKVYTLMHKEAFNKMNYEELLIHQIEKKDFLNLETQQGIVNDPLESPSYKFTRLNERVADLERILEEKEEAIKKLTETVYNLAKRLN